MIVWEILDTGKLGRWEGWWNRDEPRLYLSREAAEAKCAPICEKIHQAHIKWFLKEVELHEDADEIFEQEDIDFWNSRPELQITRTDDQTFFGAGDPDEDSRSYRAAAYGWIQRREVVE